MALGLVLSTGNSSWGKSVPSVLQEGRLSGLEEILSRVTLCLKFGESVGDKLGRGHRQGTGEALGLGWLSHRLALPRVEHCPLSPFIPRRALGSVQEGPGEPAEKLPTLVQGSRVQKHQAPPLQRGAVLCCGGGEQ